MDVGHRNLLKDLGSLLHKAEAKDFHDFESIPHATPKMALVDALEGLIAKVKKGDYDN